MTANTTEQERAEFEALASSEEYPISRCFDDGSMYEYTVTQRKWDEWQAARRAPAMPVPQWLFEAIEHGDEKHRAWLKAALTAFFEGKPIPREVAAAPQPPEAAQSNSAEFEGIKTEAAPVQLPEPAAWFFKDHTWTEIKAIGVDHGGEPAYTEHQVLAILAKHGIKTK